MLDALLTLAVDPDRAGALRKPTGAPESRRLVPGPATSRYQRIDTNRRAESDVVVSNVFPRFELTEDDSGSGAHVISVRGEIHLAIAPEFSQRLQESIDAGNTAVVLDLSGVEFIDSTGLSVLLNGLRRVTALHGQLALVCANPTVLRLFQITSLDRTFDIFADRDTACDHVTQAAGGSSGGAP